MILQGTGNKYYNTYLQNTIFNNCTILRAIQMRLAMSLPEFQYL
jgi:hypothetical protein